MCLTSASFVSTDVGTGCDTSQFQIGFLDDSTWCVVLRTPARSERWTHTSSGTEACRRVRLGRTSSLTWNQAQSLTTISTVTFSAANLTSYR